MKVKLYKCGKICRQYVSSGSKGGGEPGERSPPPKPGKIPKGWNQFLQQPAHLKNFPQIFQIFLHLFKKFHLKFQIFLKIFQIFT